MKKIYTLIAILIVSLSTYAQTPEKMSYQAVIRNTAGNLVVSTSVGMQISILQGSSTGNAVYVESQTPTTNANGLISIEIGSGTVVSGTFNTIAWSSGNYYIKTEVDPTGGANYTITGTTQLLSVPYALQAKKVENVTTISGTINITGPGVYQIVYGNGYRGIGTMSCSIDQVPNGIWNSGGTIAFSENDNTQDYLLNVVEYQLYSGGNINAVLRPLNNNNFDTVGSNIDGRVEVEVLSITQPSVLRWSLTVYPAN